MNTLRKIFAVFEREMSIWARRPLYFIGSIVVMLFCSVFYLTFLKAGVPSDVPIAIVDYDNSSLSRNFSRQLDATQLGKVIKYGTFAEARDAMQQGKVTSICVLPKGFYAGVESQRQPKITFYVNGLYFLGGSLSYKDLLTMANLTSGAVQREVLRLKGYDENRINGLIRPIDVDIHQIGNPTMNYGAYLANMMLPGVLQMIIVILTIYAFGTELKYGTSRHLMKTAGDSIAVAVTGKLTLYTILFTMIGFLLELLLYSWMKFPMAGHVENMFLDIFLLVTASEAVGLTIISLVPVTRFALSVGSLYSVLGFSLTGFTLPIEAMPAPLHGIAAMYPLRHYYLFYVQEGIFGTGFAGWWLQAVYMMLFLIVPFFLMGRLKHAYIYQDYSRD